MVGRVQVSSHGVAVDVLDTAIHELLTWTSLNVMDFQRVLVGNVNDSVTYMTFWGK